MDHELAHTSGAKKSPEQSQRSFDRDEADLVRLGKKPVLKVSSDIHSSHTVKTDTVLVAQIWVHVAIGLQLYHSHHLGRHLDVRLDGPTWT